MEKLTHWQTLWEQLSEIQSQAFARKKSNQTSGQAQGQEKDQPENQSEDFWKHKARQFDKMVEDRWSKPDSSRDFIIHKLRENPGSTLLDIGAGTGKWSVLASPHAAKVTALDPSLAMQQVLREKIQEEKITNIDIITGTWPEDTMAPHDYVLASHSMYGVKEFETFVNKMRTTATKGCIMVLRAPFADAIMAKAATRVFGQPYDSPNFQIAYNILLAMDIYPDVIMEADGSWPGWDNDNFEAALAELKNRLDLGEETKHDLFLTNLLKENLIYEKDRVVWPAGNRSALVYWEV
jgi:cyclopropane fatty-acyl-phospholipid synthase-like methyltransferase